MKFIISTFAIIGAISIALSLVFVIQLLIKNANNGSLFSQNIMSTISSSTIGNSSFIKDIIRSNATGTKPDGFKGPSASDIPHIIGPTTPPPNY